MTKPVLQNVQERLALCDEYFACAGAKTLYTSEAYREYELPRDVDKELTERPYYWLWVEQTNQKVPPSTLRLAFTDDALERENNRLREQTLQEIQEKHLSEREQLFTPIPKAELLTLGSFRLDKILTSIETRATFASVRPKHIPAGAKIIPWLMVNILVSNRCDLVHQELMSCGICLQTGQIIGRFYDFVRKLEMESVPASTLLQAATLQVDGALSNIRNHIQDIIESRDHEWALQAFERLRGELSQVDTYYSSIAHTCTEEEAQLIHVEHERKRSELKLRMEPIIELELRQIALVGLIEMH